MKKTTWLVVCRHRDDVGKVLNLRRENAADYVIASDDVDIQAEARKLPWVKATTFTERPESFFCVAEDVIKLVGEMNRILPRLASAAGSRGFSEELLFWTREAEGGETTQKVQDLFLLIRSYLWLIDTYNVRRVISISRPEWQWEDEILAAVAGSKGIGCVRYVPTTPGVLLASAWAQLRMHAKDLYSVLSITARKGLCLFQKSSDRERLKKTIVFQLCSSAEKHVENIVPLMKSLRTEGLEVLALCWSASEPFRFRNGAAKVRLEGLEADELEAWVPFSSLLAASYFGISTWRRAKKLRQDFLSELSYLSVPLAALLEPSLKHFAFVDLTQRYRIYSALKRYFFSATPLALKPWGSGLLPEGALICKILKRRASDMVLFNYFVGVVHSSPYNAKETRDPIFDVFLAAGEMERRLVIEEMQIPAERVVLTGKPRFDKASVIRKEDDRRSAAETLNIQRNYKALVFYDPGSILRGYASAVEYTLVLRALLDYVRIDPAVGLMIKPHPSHKPGILERVIADYHLENTFLFDKDTSPYQILNACDLTVTKYSTIGIESMLFEKPVISVSFEIDARRPVYGEAAVYVYTVEALHELLERILTSAQILQEWSRQQIPKQKEFLKESLYESSVPPAVLAATAVAECIRRDRTTSGWSVPGEQSHKIGSASINHEIL